MPTSLIWLPTSFIATLFVPSVPVKAWVAGAGVAELRPESEVGESARNVNGGPGEPTWAPITGAAGVPWPRPASSIAVVESHRALERSLEISIGTGAERISWP